MGLLTIGFTCKAQYNTYYNPYLYAALAAETNETNKLNNIWFDENAIKQNPETWVNYMDYLKINEKHTKKYKNYSIVGWTGVGIMCVSLIPLCKSIYEYNDSLLAWGYGLLGAGTIMSCVGVAGMIVQLNKMKINKKNFIYYLKTSNNGVGIVVLF